MRWRLFHRWLLASVCILFSGCTVWNNALRTTRFEPSLFSHKHDRLRSMAAYRGWAEEAWQQEWQAAPELGERPEYAQGFRDGFVDYTFAGGTGEPPAVPPRKLWNVLERSEEGRQRAADWFAGYRHGAHVSREGGYRSLSTLSSTLLGYRDDDSGGKHFAPEMSAEFGRAEDEEFPTVETLSPVSPTPAEPTKEREDSTRSPAEEAAPTKPTKPAQRSPKETAADAMPSAIPRELDLPEARETNDGLPPAPAQELKLELDDDTTPAVDPANPTTTPAKSNAIERIPLTIPNEPVAPEVPATDADTPEPTSQPEPSSTSVRFTGDSFAAKNVSRMRPVASPPTLLPTGQSVSSEPAKPDSSVIRLASASEEVRPAAPPEQRSTLKVRTDRNTLRGSPPTEGHSLIDHGKESVGGVSDADFAQTSRSVGMAKPHRGRRPLPQK